MKLQYSVSADNKFLAIRHDDRISYKLFSLLESILWSDGRRGITRLSGFVDPKIGFKYIGSTSYDFFNHKPHDPRYHFETFRSYEITSGPTIDIKSTLLDTFKGQGIKLEEAGAEKFDVLILDDIKLKKEGRIVEDGEAHLENAEEAVGCITKESALRRGPGF